MPAKRASPQAPNKLGAWGCGLVFHHARLLGFCLLTEEKAGLGWTEHIALASRGCPLNSRDPERVRAPDDRPKPGSGLSDPFPSVQPDHAVRQLGLTLPSVQRTMPSASLV